MRRFPLVAFSLCLLPLAGAFAAELPDFSADMEARKNEKSYVIPAAEIVVGDFLLNRWDRYHYGCCDFNVTLDSIRRNLHSRWDVDRDPFLVNQLGHPYQGAMYHGAARASGLGFWPSLAYTFAGSAFWEIAGENTPPSINDQITTGFGGAFLGEALFRIANLVLERGSNTPAWLREAAAAAISPPVGFNRYAFGDRFRRPFASHDPLYFTRLQVGFSGSERDTGIPTVGLKRNEALADFFIDYGLPGKPDYPYTRPFDYFSFQATATSANKLENAMTRGILLGKEYTVGSNYRGVWGLYGSYDYIAPQLFRVSSSSLSLGTTAQWWLSNSTAVVGTAMAGGGYTAAGTIRGGENEFNYGVAPSVLGALRFIFGDTAALDVTAREYYISRVAATKHGGHENIGRADVALTIRVHKQHGVTIKYLGNRRDASYPDLGGRTQKRQTLGLFYTFIGHDRFGAVEHARE